MRARWWWGRISLPCLTAFLLALPAIAVAQGSPLPPHVVGLIDAKRDISRSLQQLPNLVCQVEIRRTRLSAKARQKIDEKFKKRSGGSGGFMASYGVPLDSSDSLALEIAFIGGKELYAFPESPRFEERPLDELIGHGTVSTGAFAGHARNVFVNETANVRYVGEEAADGDRLWRYDYDVPQFRSGYTVSREGRAATVPWHGSFWIAADDRKVRRLTVLVDDVPADIAIERVVTQVDYHDVAVDAEHFRMPSRALTTLLARDETESVSESRFGACRSFAGSSTLSFDDATEVSYAPRMTELKTVMLPAGLTLPVELSSAIDSETAQVGTAVTATLRSDVDTSDGLVIPKGALLHGRIRRLDFYDAEADHYVVGVEFTQLRFDDNQAALTLKLVSISDLGRSRSQGSRLGSDPFSGGFEVRDARKTVSVSAARLPGVGEFSIEKKKFRLKPGFDMTWLTVSAER